MQSPVAALASQARVLQEGLGNTKPPKKKVRTLEASKVDALDKPSVVKCKKKKGNCNHEIVFGVHYDKKSWENYASKIWAKSSITEVDPNYLP